MNNWIATSLAILVAGLVWFDQREQRIPNRVTLPLLVIFILLNWPGVPETWLGCTLLFLGWKGNWLGGGDAKLWMALLWAVPAERGNMALFASRCWQFHWGWHIGQVQAQASCVVWPWG